eukprot:GFKZ01009323.1.p1 GENE.GFKZ01009323.1~~GFKZ01009323.1.p1  ORF type:complete len:2075 (-),score=344.78 GFKZ01009323.1:33-6257(-)
MSGVRSKSWEGDLFPRGKAPTATPRIRKRDGQVVFTASKRQRVRPTIPDETSEQSVTRVGAMLSISKVSVGMTLLAVVTRADRLAVNFALPGAVRAVADPEEVLLGESRGDQGIKMQDSESGAESDSGSENDSEMEDEAEEEEMARLWEVVRVGDVVRVSLVSLETGQNGGRVIRVSMKPELVNAGLNPAFLLSKGFGALGAVHSVEDHGAVVSFGGHVAYTAFLKGSGFRLGEPVEVVTKKQTERKKRCVIKVSNKRSDVLNAKVEGELSYADLRAGMLIKGIVGKTGESGAVVNIRGVLAVAVDAAHIPKTDKGWAVTPSDNVLVRLLFVDIAAKRAVGSLLECWVERRQPRDVPEGWRVGMIMKRLRVDVVKPGFGIAMTYLPIARRQSDEPQDAVETDAGEVSDGGEETDSHSVEIQTPILAHISCVSDSKGVNLQSMFQKGMILTTGARVVSVSKLDGIVNVDMRPSILKRKALSIDEIVEGDSYQCRIVSHTAFGSVFVSVEDDPRLPGLIPVSNISDVPLSKGRLAKHPKFSIGASLQCRALYIDKQKGRVILTSKNSLVTPKYSILRTFDEAERALQESQSSPKGACFTGYVTKVLPDRGIVVGFCANVAGKVHFHELGMNGRDTRDATVADIEEMFPVGQTVNVRVTKVISKLRRLWLSMDVRQKKPKDFQIGRKLNGIITRLDRNAKVAVVTVSGKDVFSSAAEGSDAPEDQENLEGILPYGHLSDVPGMTDKIVREIEDHLSSDGRAEDKKELPVEELLLLHAQDGIPVLSMKPSLKEAVSGNRLPRSFEDLCSVSSRSEEVANSDIRVRGYVKALMQSGVIVGFLGDVVGFAHVSRIANHFVSDPGRILKLNQSVTAVVTSVDKEKERALLSLRPSEVGNQEHVADTISFFGSLRNWQDTLLKENLEKEFPIGSVMKVPCGREHKYGFVYDLKTSSGNTIGVALGIEEHAATFPEYGASPLGGRQEVDSAIGPRKGKAKSSKSGEEENVRVLDVDPLSGVVDLSRDATVVDGGRKKALLNVGDKFSAKILLVKGGYLILAVARSKTRTAVAFALSPAISDNLAIRPGMLVQCTALDKSLANTKRNLVTVDWKLFRSRISSAAQNLREEGTTKFSKTISTLLNGDHKTEESVVGMEISGKIRRRFQLNATMSIAKGLVGHLHITNTSSLTSDEKSNIPLGIIQRDIASRFSLPEEGTTVREAYVAGIRSTSDGEESGPMIIEVSLSRDGSKRDKLTPGVRVVGFVKNLSPRFSSSSDEKDDSKVFTHTRVVISPSVTVSCRDVDCLPVEDKGPLKIGMPVMCQITDTDDKGVRATISENGSNDRFFTGIVLDVLPGTGVRVEVPWLARSPSSKNKSWGIVSLCDVDKDFDKVQQVIDSLKKGDAIRVRRIRKPDSGEPEGNGEPLLSMRDITDDSRDPIITEKELRNLKVGLKVRGFVRAINKKGCFVAIGREIYAQALLSDISDDFVHDLQKSFPVGKLVSGKISKVDNSKGKPRVSLVLRKRPRKILREGPGVSDMKEGTVVRGIVKRVESYGAVLELSKGVTALLHKKEADQDRFIKNPAEEWAVSQKLAAIVIKIDEKGIKVGTKRCYFEAAGFDDDQTDRFLSANEASKTAIVQDTRAVKNVEMISREERDEGHATEDVEKELAIDEVALSESDDDQDVAVITDEGKDEETVAPSPPTKTIENSTVAPLDIGQSFLFDEGQQVGSDAKESSDDDKQTRQEKIEEPVIKKKTSRDKREKKRQREAAERAIRLREEALANNPDSPETAEDFERLLVGEPNSSVLWIQYMAFCVSLSQIDKARSIAERAIETIDMNEEADRCNVWIAYLNLEARYGSANALQGDASDKLGFKRDAAVFRVFDRACGRVTDVKSFYLQAASALRGTSHNLADEVLRRASRKFKGSKQVWIANGLAQFKGGDLAGARRTLEKALVCLEKQKHIAVISKFAQLEYKYGSAERGRTVFESLVGNFPKRLDLWNIYLDMETGQCRNVDEDAREEVVERARNVFERCTALELSSKKMKFLFQKWLGFEKLFGDKVQRAKVKERAREFVERSAAAADQ